MCGCLESGVPLPLHISEISRGDVRVTTDRPLKFGTQIALIMYLDFVSGTVPGRGVVHWCRPSIAGWELGLYLNSPIPENMLSQSWWELRDSLRFPCNWSAWLEIPEIATRQPMRIHNYSLGGIKITSSANLKMGQEFGICTSMSQYSAPVMLGRVERIDPAPNQYGCYLAHEAGRFLPGVFHQSSALHIETPCSAGLSARTSLLPEMIDRMPTGGFASLDGSYINDGN